MNRGRSLGTPGVARPGARVVVPGAGERAQRPWAVGYVSAPGPVGPGVWTRWYAQVERHALQRGLPMLHVYSDELDGRHGAAARADGGGGVGDWAAMMRIEGLAQMVSAMREVVELRSGHVSVVIVPALEHLSPARDGSEHTVAMLLRMHLGVRVEPDPGLNDTSWA